MHFQQITKYKSFSLDLTIKSRYLHATNRAVAILGPAGFQPSIYTTFVEKMVTWQFYNFFLTIFVVLIRKIGQANGALIC